MVLILLLFPFLSCFFFCLLLSQQIDGKRMAAVALRGVDFLGSSKAEWRFVLFVLVRRRNQEIGRIGRSEREGKIKKQNQKKTKQKKSIETHTRKRVK